MQPMSDAFSAAELESQRAFLRRLARGLVRGEAAAEDLVQEAFVRALERPPASARAPRAWLASVLRRLVLNHARSAGRTAERECRAARPERVEPPDEALASLELQARLVAAVKGLDEPYRTTLWLRYHEDLPPRAIAERLAAPVKTIEARLARGLAALRAELDRRAGGDRTQWLGGVLVLAHLEFVSVGHVIGAGLMKKAALSVAVALTLLLGWRILAPAGVGEPLRVQSRDGEDLRSIAGAPIADAGRPERVPAAPEPSAGSRSEVTSLVVRVRWSDGSPAPGVGLIVHPLADPRGERALLFLSSDDQGLARLPSIHSGQVRIHADRGGQIEGAVSLGQENVLELTLADGIQLEGTVTDQ
jgi:RNA polymerase sigma-70 factor (ECF subfamily)